MFPLANMVHFFADEFTCLSACSFALPFVPAGTFESLLFRHIRKLRTPRSLFPVG